MSSEISPASSTAEPRQGRAWFSWDNVQNAGLIILTTVLVWFGSTFLGMKATVDSLEQNEVNAVALENHIQQMREDLNAAEAKIATLSTTSTELVTHTNHLLKDVAQIELKLSEMCSHVSKIEGQLKSSRRIESVD